MGPRRGRDPSHLAAPHFRSPPLSTGMVPQVLRQPLCAGLAIILRKDMETIAESRKREARHPVCTSRYDSLPPQKKTRRSALRFLRVRSVVGKNVR